jgi:hypothetical protein
MSVLSGSLFPAAVCTCDGIRKRLFRLERPCIRRVLEDGGFPLLSGRVRATACCLPVSYNLFHDSRAAIAQSSCKNLTARAWNDFEPQTFYPGQPPLLSAKDAPISPLSSCSGGSFVNPSFNRSFSLLSDSSHLLESPFANASNAPAPDPSMSRLDRPWYLPLARERKPLYAGHFGHARSAGNDRRTWSWTRWVPADSGVSLNCLSLMLWNHCVPDRRWHFCSGQMMKFYN